MEDYNELAKCPLCRTKVLYDKMTINKNFEEEIK